MNRVLARYADIVFRHGPLSLVKIVLARFSPLEKWRYQRAIRDGRVYLGEYLSARQGVLARHQYMTMLVGRLAETPGLESPELLEVGSWAGGSTITLANALAQFFGKGHITCVDSWAESYDLTSRNVWGTNSAHRKALRSGKVFELFQHNIEAAGFSETISFHKCKFSDWTTSKRFDLAYIDADHRYDAVMHDLKKADQLLRVGGFLCGDDLERQYSEVDPEFCRAHGGDDFVFEGRVACAHFHPGVTAAVHDFFSCPVSIYEGFWLMKKVSDGEYARFDLESPRRPPSHGPVP